MTQQTPSVHLILKKIDLLFCYRRDKYRTGMDWISCNLCCRQPGDERDRTFALSSCGHFFCDLCLARVPSREKCAVCNSTCQLMQLSSKMKPDAEVFFQEPAALIKKQYTLITRLLDFQRDHRFRLVSFHRKIVQKYHELEKQAAINKSQEAEKYAAAKNRIQELELEVQRLRDIIASKENSATGGGGGSSNTIGRTPSPKHRSPGGTLISDGRLTMVKKNQGTGAVGGRVIPNISPTPPFGPQQGGGGGSRGMMFSPVASQYMASRHTDPASHPIPGIGFYKNISPVVSRKSSPARTMGGHISQMPPPTTSANGTPGFQPFLYPSQSQPRSYTPNYSTPDPYNTRLSHELTGYKKYNM